MQFDPVVAMTATLVLSYVFVVASLHKWSAIAEFRSTLQNYQVLPEGLTGGFVYVVPLLEFLCGIALLVPYSSRLAALGAGLLLLVYMSAIGINLARGRRSIDCGCGGSGQKQAISTWLLLRNSILLFLAYCITAPEVSRQLLWLDWVVVLLATALGCLFYNIVNQLLVNKDLLKVLETRHG